MAFLDKVNATLSNVGGSISNATSKAQKSLKTMQAVGSLNSQINAQQAAIQTAYAAIGEAYVAAHLDETDCEYADQVAIVKAARDAIADMQAQIQALKGVATCPSCGA